MIKRSLIVLGAIAGIVIIPWMVGKILPNKFKFTFHMLNENERGNFETWADGFMALFFLLAVALLVGGIYAGVDELIKYIKEGE